MGPGETRDLSTQGPRSRRSRETLEATFARVKRGGPQGSSGMDEPPAPGLGYLGGG
jgi:hypothetical protein